MRFRFYPRVFRFALLNIMNTGKGFLKATDGTYLGTHNSVVIESDGMIDPYRPISGLGW